MNDFYAGMQRLTITNDEGNPNSIQEITPEISTIQNHIFFYADVTDNSLLKLNTELSKMCKTSLGIASSNGLEKPMPITLHICSAGGNIFPALFTFDYIQEINKKVQVNTMVEGMAASAASLIAIAGNKRYISPSSIMLIHELFSTACGKFNEIKTHYENSKLLEEKVEEIYLSKTKIKKEEIKDILQNDQFFNAKTCIKYGLVDEIKTIYL